MARCMCTSGRFFRVCYRLAPLHKVDADTSVPYCVVGAPPPPPPPSGGLPSGGFFNLVVCHDLFDNYERMKIVVSPLIARYPGAQVREELMCCTLYPGVAWCGCLLHEVGICHLELFIEVL